MSKEGGAAVLSREERNACHQVAHPFQLLNDAGLSPGLCVISSCWDHMRKDLFLWRHDRHERMMEEVGCAVHEH